MSWNISWEGRATDFVPNLLKTLGKPGKLALTARDALWEAVQRVGEHNSQGWVKVSGHGWEDPDQPGLGKFSVHLEVVPEPGEIHKRISEAQPVDVRSSDNT